MYLSYLRTLLGFLGVKDFTTSVAEGLDLAGADVRGIVERAKREAEEYVKLLMVVHTQTRMRWNRANH